MKFKSILIKNFHNLEEKEVNLEQFTYIKGMNGTGKTSILQALQLGVVGFIPGIAKTNSAIVEHANNLKDPLEIDLELVENGEVIHVKRSWQKIKSKIEYKESVYPEMFNLKYLQDNALIFMLNFTAFLEIKRANFAFAP